MAVKKKISGFVIHISISCVVLVISFIAGMKVGGRDEGGISDQVSTLRSEIEDVSGLIEKNNAKIEQNLGQISSNKQDCADISRKLRSVTAALSRDTADLSRKIESVTTTFSRDVVNIKSGFVNSAQQLDYYDKVLGLKWFKRSTDGHLYCLTPYPLPWHYAQDFARKLGGNLASIEDEAENKWLADSFGSKTEYWIGLTDEHAEGKWRWSNGKAAKYTNWSSGEPDNYKQIQHYVVFNNQGASDKGKWNDVAGNEVKIGIIELEN